MVTPSKRIGTRRQVWLGHAHHTAGGLTHGDLKINSAGVLVSKKASSRAAARFKSDPRLAKLRDNQANWRAILKK